MKLCLVEARTVAEHIEMLPEAFAVVRGDDHPGPLQEAAAFELVGQLAELFIESGDAVVVRVAGKSDLPRGKLALVQRPPVVDEIISRSVRGLAPKRWMPRAGSLYGKWASK